MVVVVEAAVCRCAYSLHVAGAVEAPHDGVAGRRHATVGSLGPAQTELQQPGVVADDVAVPGGVRRNQTGVVDEHEEGGLHQLRQRQRTLDADQRHAWEHDRALLDGVDAQGTRLQTPQVVEERLHTNAHGLRPVFQCIPYGVRLRSAD